MVQRTARPLHLGTMDTYTVLIRTGSYRVGVGRREGCMHTVTVHMMIL